MTSKKEMYDDIYQVIKGNSGAISANDATFTEIFDLQIPRGYAARIRKVIFHGDWQDDQTDQTEIDLYGALVLDPDDETSYQIPTFEIDHDVLTDVHFCWRRLEEDTTPNGIAMIHCNEVTRDFTEELDVITVRNIRFNTQGHGLKVDGTTKAQLRCTVYFTYEKVSAALYEKLLGIK